MQFVSQISATAEHLRGHKLINWGHPKNIFPTPCPELCAIQLQIRVDVAACTYYIIICIITGRMPQSGKLSVLNLLSGQKSEFSPRRGDSLHRPRAPTTDHRPPTVVGCTDHVHVARESAWPHEISRQSVHGGGNATSKWQKFPVFGKESPHRGEPFDLFLQLLGAFIRPTILH